MRNPEPGTGPFDQQAHATPIVPDRTEAERFLTALDPKAKGFTFQTFDDNEERKDERKVKRKKDPLAKVLNGTLAEHWKELVKLNAKGAGVFVTANRTNLKGRTYADMSEIRVVFADLDGAPLDTVLAEGALTPHIIDESSPGRFHAYWRIDGEPLADLFRSLGPNDYPRVEAKALFEKFSGVQKTIAARCGGDLAVHDLPRVMRLPGFVHAKAAPFLSRVITINDIEPYPWSKLLEIFPPVEEKPKPERPGPPRDDDDLPKRWKFLNTYALDHLDLWVPRQFPAAVKSKQGWRVSSAALGRNLEEDISFTRDGIKDFGVHDMGDPRHGSRTAIDIVEEWNRCDFEAAVRWLCQALGLDARGYLPGEGKPITNGRGGSGRGGGPGGGGGGPGDDDGGDDVVDDDGGGGGGPAPKPRPKPKPSDADKLLAALNGDHCVVLDGARTRVLRFEEIEYDAGGEHYKIRVPTFLRFEDFRNFYLHRRIDIGQGHSMDWGRWWLNHPRRRQYVGVVFKPGGKQVINGKLNLWTGWGVTPKAGDWSLLREHMYEVLAARDDDVDTYNFKWCAWAVQHADQQPETALVFLGDPGTGRSTLGKALCKIFGQHSLHISSSDHLTGRFTGHFRQCSFLFADEAYAPNDKSAEGRLKRMITEDTLTIEPKGRDLTDEPNRLHVMMASNNDWVVPAGAHERRYAVQQVAETHRQDPAWFGPIYDQLRNGGYEAMLFDLLHYDLGDWHPRQIVRTAALAEQQEQSLSPSDAWWLELLQTGKLTGADGLAPDRAISNKYETEESTGSHGGKRTIKHDGLYDQARSISPKLRGAADAALGRYLRKRHCTRVWVYGERGWQFPSLAKCRADWLARFPQTTWDDQSLVDWTRGEE